MRNSVTHSDKSSVCILRLTALGDCINAFGIANAIHEDYPEVKIKWIIDSRFSSLFISDGKPIVPMVPVEIKKQGLLDKQPENQNIVKYSSKNQFGVLSDLIKHL